jgi:hypothetical protein
MQMQRLSSWSALTSKTQMLQCSVPQSVPDVARTNSPPAMLSRSLSMFSLAIELQLVNIHERQKENKNDFGFVL